MRLTRFAIAVGEATNYDTDTSAYAVSTDVDLTDAATFNTLGDGAGFGTPRDNIEVTDGDNPTSHGNHNVYVENSVTSGGGIKFDGKISGTPEPNNLSNENYVFTDIIMFVPAQDQGTLSS